MSETILLSDRAADREVLAPACRIVETLIRLHGLAICGWSMVGARGEAPALPVLDLDRNANPIEGEHPLTDLPEDVEPSQFWIVSECRASPRRERRGRPPRLRRHLRLGATRLRLRDRR